jgi:hypothetical protein
MDAISSGMPAIAETLATTSAAGTRETEGKSAKAGTPTTAGTSFSKSRNASNTRIARTCRDVSSSMVSLEGGDKNISTAGSTAAETTGTSVT